MKVRSKTTVKFSEKKKIKEVCEEAIKPPQMREKKGQRITFLIG